MYSISGGVTGFLGSPKICPCEEQRLKDTQNLKCEDRRFSKFPSFEDMKIWRLSQLSQKIEDLNS